jgi:hypothetical protein
MHSSTPNRYRKADYEKNLWHIAERTACWHVSLLRDVSSRVIGEHMQASSEVMQLELGKYLTQVRRSYWTQIASPRNLRQDSGGQQDRNLLCCYGHSNKVRHFKRLPFF